MPMLRSVIEKAVLSVRAVQRKTPQVRIKALAESVIARYQRDIVSSSIVPRGSRFTPFRPSKPTS
jgi:hypothetical protein